MHLSRKAFTLIELLVVIAIIAILSVVVILTLNPAELLRQSRDSSRVSDMTTLTSALGLYSTDQSSASGFSMGSSTTIYVSIPDPAATSTAGSNCSSLGLPTIPSTYSYHCAASSTFRNTNGTGWIPVNLTLISSGSPVGNLPVDPINQSSSHLYYTYATNGIQYEITSAMESAKYSVGGSNDIISGDGGTLGSVYEKGSKLGLEPMDYGDASLVGYWTMDEGTGTLAYDYSGYGNAGNLSGGTTWTTGQVGSGAILFATNGAVTTASSTSLTIKDNTSIAFWIKDGGTTGSYASIVGSDNTGLTDGYFVARNATTTGIFLRVDTSAAQNQYAGGIANVLDGNWHHIVWTLSGGATKIYKDGALVSTNTYLPGTGLSDGTNYVTLGKIGTAGFIGSLDDVRIYNRVLSVAQVATLYAGGK